MEGLIEVARLLATAGAHWTGASRRERLHDLAFAALARARKDPASDPGALADDPSLAPLLSDPRWTEVVRGR